VLLVPLQLAFMPARPTQSLPCRAALDASSRDMIVVLVLGVLVAIEIEKWVWRRLGQYRM
jgi:hypothetical protein